MFENDRRPGGEKGAKNHFPRGFVGNAGQGLEIGV